MSEISLEQRACPICETRDDTRLYASANVCWEELDRFAFASRKLPEYMHWQLGLCGHCDLVYALESPAPEALERCIARPTSPARRKRGLLAKRTAGSSIGSSTGCPTAMARPTSGRATARFG